MKRSLAVGTAAVGLLALALGACSSGGGGTTATDGTSGAATAAAGAGGSGSCTNKIVHADAKQVTVWAWYPAFE
ncbi:hypothetical protein BH11ACT1_BH11ACT1_27070 [soil metagenome]